MLTLFCYVTHYICYAHQVPQILNPVVLVLDELPRLAQNPQLGDYIASVFGSVDNARKAILTDFCRHAFDGSGADVSGSAAALRCWLAAMMMSGLCPEVCMLLSNE
eukprot:GHRQ01038662.1.p1 GENE.GHRQ01038662.1~~GHRQ01038662.1.p1  ORF type:complete len:106 (-),score=32.79 GHRQ01038662.1:111-428(-)